MSEVGLPDEGKCDTSGSYYMSVSNEDESQICVNVGRSESTTVILPGSVTNAVNIQYTHAGSECCLLV